MPEIRIVHLDPPRPCGVCGAGRTTCGQPAEYATVAPAPSCTTGARYLIMLPICHAHASSMAEVYHIERATYDLTAAEFADFMDCGMSAALLPDLPDADADLILVTASVKIPRNAEPPILEAAASLMDQAIARMMKDSEKLRERARCAVEGN